MSPSLQFPKIHSLQLAVHDMKVKVSSGGTYGTILWSRNLLVLDSLALASLEEASSNEKCAGPALGASTGTGTFQSELIRLWTGEKLGIAADLISTPRHPGHSPPPLSSWTRPQHSGTNPLFCGHGIIRRVTNLFWIFLPFSPVFMPAAT